MVQRIYTPIVGGSFLQGSVVAAANIPGCHAMCMVDIPMAIDGYEWCEKLISTLIDFDVSLDSLPIRDMGQKVYSRTASLQHLL